MMYIIELTEITSLYQMNEYLAILTQYYVNAINLIITLMYYS